MNLKKIVKVTIISISLLLAGTIGKFSSKKDMNPAELEAVQKRIEVRIEVLKKTLDARFGDGFFEEMVSVKPDEEESHV